MAKFKEKLQATQLRKRGKSIGFISSALGVSKSTVSLWCRDVELTDKQKELLERNAIKAGNRGRMLGTLANTQRRINTIKLCRELSKKDIVTVSQRDFMITAAALFWAEGAKTGSRFTFINSDPAMILCMVKFLKEIMQVDRSRLYITIQINKVHEPRIKKVLFFWSSYLKLPLKQFGKPYYINIKPKKIYENHDSYHGIARLSVRNGSSLQYRMLGYIDVLKDACQMPM